MIEVPKQFAPHIRVDYPQNNKIIFEEWIGENFIYANTDRIYLPIFWTSYYVNNGYGQHKRSIHDLQIFIDSLDKSKRYWTIIQYDDSILNDVSGIDLLQFNMSKQNGIMLPLLCQPHPYKFKGGKKWFASFVGSRTHEIRDSANMLKSNSDYYVSFENHPIEQYCKIIYESMFTLCYRGYGANSFRIAESLQYGSIPVYISDEFILPEWVEFEKFGILITHESQYKIDEILQSVPLENLIEKQDYLQEAYEKYFSYEANLKHIIRTLETECNQRK